MTVEATGTRPSGCANHPGRAPVGRCIRCRRSVCAECHTRLDGILHCRDCLDVAAQGLQQRRSRGATRVVTALAAVLVLIPALLLARFAVHAFGLAAGRLTRLGAVQFERLADEDGPR